MAYTDEFRGFRGTFSFKPAQPAAPLKPAPQGESRRVAKLGSESNRWQANNTAMIASKMFVSLMVSKSSDFAVICQVSFYLNLGFANDFLRAAPHSMRAFSSRRCLNGCRTSTGNAFKPANVRI